MTRAQIEKSLITAANGANWLSVNEIATYLGCNRQGSPVRRATDGLPRFGKKYSARDLSERLFALQTAE